MASDVKVGDRIKVTREEEIIVTYVGRYNPEGYDGKTPEGKFASVTLGLDGVVAIEKIEPPVEQFKPGDVVRNGSALYALGRNGYLQLASPGVADCATGGRVKYVNGAIDLAWFNSGNGFEKVAL